MRALTCSLVLIAALAACKKKDPAPGNPGNGGGVDPAGYDERQACTADDDCTFVQAQCCDHCNGGEAIGVHRDFAREVQASFAEDCGGTACTKRGCEAPTPLCTNGVCGLKIGDFVTTPMLPAR